MSMVHACSLWCAAAAAAAESGPPATWGQVCIAMLIQRASDKAAAVRAKAVGNLASIIELWCSQKAGPLAASLGQFRQVWKSWLEQQALVEAVVNNDAWFATPGNKLGLAFGFGPTALNCHCRLLLLLPSRNLT